MYNVVHAIQEAIDASRPWADINPQSKSYWTNEWVRVSFLGVIYIDNAHSV